MQGHGDDGDEGAAGDGVEAGPGGGHDDQGRRAAAAASAGGAGAAGEAGDDGGGEGEQGAGEELVGAGVGAVVGPVGVGCAQQPRPRQRATGAGGDCKAQQPGLAGAEAAGGNEQAAQQQGPQQVELFLHRQRPEMQHRVVGHVGAEVVRRLGDEIPVGDVQERCFEPARGVEDLHR